MLTDDKERVEKDDGVCYEDCREAGGYEEDEWVSRNFSGKKKRQKCSSCGGYSVIEKESGFAKWVRSCGCGRTCL